MAKEIGEIGTILKQIEWKIPEFFATSEDQDNIRYCSPAFSYGDILWYLSLWPNWGDQNEEFIELFLRTDAKREYSLEYYFGFKKCDGNVEQLVAGVIKGCEICSSSNHLIKKKEIPLRKSELMPGNVLTIMCTLKLMTESSISPQPATLLEKTKPQKLIRLDKLSANFKELCADKESCDVILKVKDKEYKAHKSVLIARSNVFAATFKHDTLEKQTGIITIPDCDPDSFQLFLEYLYSGELEELSFCSALNLYYTSDKYNVEELKAFSVEFLIQYLEVETVCEIVVLADKYDETQLFSAAQDFFNKNVTQILLTSEWQCLMKNNYRLANKLLIEMSKVKLGDCISK